MRRCDVGEEGCGRGESDLLIGGRTWEGWLWSRPVDQDMSCRSRGCSPR